MFGCMILGEENLATLERAFTVLKNAGARWRSRETQCVLHYILNFFQPGDLLNPEFCDGLDNIIISARESPEVDQVAGLHEEAPKSSQASRTYIEDASSGSLRSFPDILMGNSEDDLYQNDLDSTYAKALPPDFENNDSSIMFTSPIEQFESILFPSEDDSKGVFFKRREDSQSFSNFELSEETRNRASRPGDNGFKFERQERLDVKKPGPWFAINNFAFGDSFAGYDEALEDQASRDPYNALERNGLLWAGAKSYPPAIPATIMWKKLRNRVKDADGSKLGKKSDVTDDPELPKSKLHASTSDIQVERDSQDTAISQDNRFNTKLESDLHVNQESPRANNREVVEANYVFITVKGGVTGDQVSFRIMPNDRNMDPFVVVEKADDLRGNIRQLSGLEVVSVGIGDEAKVASVFYRHHTNRQLFNILLVCFVTTAVLATVIILWLLRRRWLVRRKLKDVTSASNQEVSRDYQDLCRARMASKTFDGSKDLPRITQPHLSRDSESSRSSTSSWCEEPVLTNMDISTGHMVLSYMEDHLRNRDRLDREWMALCAYEAEPCVSVGIGSKVEFKDKNRYEDILPYDHSRVVINSLANPGGFDYINASLIADHDPRHPAYIAAQAPVADSVADFWQMIWEQGAVVLVLLTRLIENGKEQCHLYWPTEGSQLYHIYEVHLVSEHIWCDDYLVRSFYLKNIRTGETRTVTQFHFLSWAESGVPASTRALLEFRRKINKSYRGRSSPILVHCSDGAGRTGTYCLIDMVLHRMAKGAREIDIAATLEHVRDQRMKAVRTKQQFEFVLTAVAEEVHAILRALPQ
nr:EOG090X01LO [Moina brachiata]